MLLVEAGRDHDVFEVVELTDGVARVRSPFLFEVGEELKVRIENNGTTTETVVRVRAHTGQADAKITELELVS
ncbi:MAG TPA: hypothetical protein VLB44_10275 [Kofleriaceae bacterium]|nr:hypothetical protein [Kofleriaceae bacterium]